MSANKTIAFVVCVVLGVVNILVGYDVDAYSAALLIIVAMPD